MQLLGSGTHRGHAVKLWAQVRGLFIIVGSIVATLLVLVLPVSAAAVTPSPAGATLAAACLVALIVPIAVGWGCSRADRQVEAVTIRPVRLLDFLLAVASVGLVAILAGSLMQLGIAPAGGIAARASLVFLGLLLACAPFGWHHAALSPTLYVLAVAVAGRGEDIIHPAPWAWIAAPVEDGLSWVLSALVLAAGILLYVAIRPRLAVSSSGAE